MKRLGFVFVWGFVFLFWNTGWVKAADSYMVSGSFDFSPIMKAQMTKTKNTTGSDFEIAKEKISRPSVNRVSLSVSEDGVVEGRGRISEYKAEWWSMWGDEIAPYSQLELRDEYWIALVGSRKGSGFSGDAVVRISSGKVRRVTWSAGKRGNQIQGKIKGFWQGMDLEFTLEEGDDVLPVELDEAIKGELEEELSKSGVVVVGDPEERKEWSADLMGVNNAYVIQDGEAVPLTDGMVLEPGMEIKTEGEDGLAVFRTANGEYIRLQGESKVTLMTTETVKDEEWKEILDQYTTRKSVVAGVRDWDKANPLMSRESVTVMQAGQMVVKYEARGGVSGWWNAAFKKDQFVDTEASSIGFARPVAADKDEPVKVVAENHSVVEYSYGEDIVEIKVYEGEVVLWKIDLKGEESLEMGRVGEGEVASLDLRSETVVEKGAFNVSEKSEAVNLMMKETVWWKRLIFKIKGLFKKK